jgi:hypothetical protein
MEDKLINQMDYKKYSLEQLSNWIHDALSCSEATPQEIYDVIKGVVSENYHIYKNHTERCYELLALLNGGNHIEQQVRAHGELLTKEDVLRERQYYEGFACTKDDKSFECKKAWNDFCEENYYPEEHSKHTKKVEDVMSPCGHSDSEALCYSEEELNAMCDKAESDVIQPKTYDEMIADGWEMTADGFWIKDPKEDKVVKWQLPVEVDGISGEYYIQFPDDLMEASGIKEDDLVEWIDHGDGSFELRKVTKPIGMEEC